MKTIALLFLVLSTYLTNSQDLSNVNIQTFPVKASVRSIEVIDENNIWFAGSKGVYGYTVDGGNTWNIDSIEHDGKRPEFRSLAVTKKAVMMLSIGSPALLYRSEDQGRSWDIVYTESNDATFYDAMEFWDDKYGIAIGDPVDGCLSIIKTTNGGKTWTKLPCSIIPEAAEGEGCFAASDTNVKLIKKNIWIVSGGPVARVYHSPDRGKSWSFVDSPIIQGQQMTGIFSTDFHNDKDGIIIGGNWNEMENNSGNIAVTEDGGKTWNLISEGEGPGYRSCVKYVDEQDKNKIIAVGIPGMSFSKDGGKTWLDFSKESFYAIRLVPGQNKAWLSGNQKLGLMTW